MSLLFPAMLLGLLALALPVALHLIARHKYQVQEFPSVQLLRADERTNVFAMRLVDVGQLLLRLAVLLLLVLAMARLFAGWWPLGRAARNLIVAVDCSASMGAMGRQPPDGATAPLIDRARAKAAELLRRIAAPSQCALVAAGDDALLAAPLRPSPDRALEALDALRVSDGTGRGLVHAVARCCDLLRGRREVRSHIVVLTDLAASAFDTRNQEDLRRIQAALQELGRRLEIVVVDVAGGPMDNVAILRAEARGHRVKVGDDAHVIARVLNSGAKDQKAKLQLAVGDRREPTGREVTIAPGAEAEVDLTLRAARAGRAVVEVRLDGADSLPADDTFGVPLEVADARRVLIVHATEPAAHDRPRAELLPPSSEIANRKSQVASEEALDGATILRFVLNPGRELGRPQGTGIQATMVAPEAIAGQPLSKYDLVALYGVSALPEQALKDLETFAQQGRAVLFVAASGTNAMKFNRAFAALSPAELGNELALDPPAGIRYADSQHPVLAPFRDRLKGDLSAVRFAAARQVRRLAAGASVLLAATDGRPLAAEMPIGQGRAVLLAFGLELHLGNIARTRVFPALMWRLVSYLTGDLRSRLPDTVTAGRPAVLDVSEPAFAFQNSLELAPLGPSPAPAIPLSVSGERTVVLPPLPVGRFVLQKPQGVAPGSLPAARAAQGRYVAVNPDPSESHTERLREDQVADRFGAPVRLVGATEDLALEAAGGELTPTLIVLLILAYAAEGGVGWLLNARRERQRVAGGPRE